MKCRAPILMFIGVGLVTFSVFAADPVSKPSATRTTADWWSPNDPRPLAAMNVYRNTHGVSTLLNTAGTIATQGHPFFTPLGTNGRACITCHQPADAMGLSVESIQLRWRDTQGKDPLFAAIDGSNCPHLPQDDPASHSLLLERGLIRVFREWPPKTPDGQRIEPQFSIEVVRDPTGCNMHPVHGLKSKNPTISVYRRPRPVANMKYATSIGFAFEPKNGLPLPIDHETGQQTTFNILADARVFTLRDQARDAIRSHLQGQQPTNDVVDALVQFENQLFAAQSHDAFGGSLTAGGAQGGPEALRDANAGELQYAGSPVWKEFLPWKKAAGENATNKEHQAFRESVARGAELFATRTFLIWDAAGITSMQFGNPVRNSCAFCHNMQRTGMDVAPGQVDLGTTNEPWAKPAPELPLFKLTCKPGFKPHPHLGRVVYTQDPGYALSTGRCIDIGKITLQQMRGLAARAPYFANGSAATLRELVDFYDQRYNIRFSEQEKQDLVNLMSVL
jgi:hypothetical protein